jgi:hypothetical protein
MHFVHESTLLSPLCQVYKIYQIGYNKGVLERQLVLLDEIDIKERTGTLCCCMGFSVLRRNKDEYTNSC